MYYKYFADHLEHCEVITYADDTVIFISDKNVSNIEPKLNIGLEKVLVYFQERKIKGYAFWFESPVEKGWKPFKCHV